MSLQPQAGILGSVLHSAELQTSELQHLVCKACLYSGDKGTCLCVRSPEQTVVKALVSGSCHYL